MIGRLMVLGCAIMLLARAERLPAKVYTTADGLAHNSVHRIFRDSRGLLWFCTAEGLSRFDGYSFTSYGVADGLPNPNVHDILETKSGIYWVATGGGLCRFAPKFSHPNQPIFKIVTLPAEVGFRIHTLAEGHDGTLWVGTEKGLCRSTGSLSDEPFRVVHLEVPHITDWGVTALLEDEFRTLWIGTERALHRRWSDGRLELFQPRALSGRNYWTISLRHSGQNRILASTSRGLWTFRPTPMGVSDERLFTHTPGGHTDYVSDVLPRADGCLWAVLFDGVSRSSPDGPQSGTSLIPLAASIGLDNFPLEAIAEDREGNLWIGSDGGGVSRIAHNGFVTFGEADGLGSHDIVSVFENSRGQLFAVSRSSGSLFLNLFSGGKFHAIRINLPSELVSKVWHGKYQVVVEGVKDWWVATHSGLARFSALADPAALARAKPRYDLPGENIFRLFQDRTSGLWISYQHSPENRLVIRNPQTGTFDRFPYSSGGPDLATDRVQAFSQDHAGDVWMGLERGALWRRSAAGFRHYGTADGAPGGSINWLQTDGAGHIWVGSSTAGVSRMSQPDSEHPSFTSYTTKQGLSSNEIQCITEDLAGRIYLCTARGVDSLDSVSGRVKHYTTADGLAGGELQTAFRDRSGALWFGTQQGLSRFASAQDRPANPVPVIVTGIRVEGVPLPVSPAGETQISLPELAPGRDQVQIDFVGLSFGTGDVPQYEYSLDGAGEAWSPPTPQHSVTYAGLRSRSYRFLVRAVNSNGLVSPQPASVAFRVLAPIWLRWWSLLAAFTAISLFVYSSWRYRMRQLAAVQRVRMRIATDLHDDIGSSLSQIAILSEVWRKKSHQETAGALDQIAHLARELVDSMSDIVWATDPNRDRVGDLAQRMRLFAGEGLGGSDVEFRLLVNGITESQKLSPNVRRQIYLIFKECIHNVTRHSAATQAIVHLERENGSLVLKIVDNGKGFEALRSYPGRGLASIRERAKSVGANVQWTSAPGGTTVKLSVPCTLE
jgi:ligand-binding sensor domain-containing protein/two-component sensor histidine kinase